jgi:hypothetical protein
MMGQGVDMTNAINAYALGRKFKAEDAVAEKAAIRTNTLKEMQGKSPAEIGNALIQIGDLDGAMAYGKNNSEIAKNTAQAEKAQAETGKTKQSVTQAQMEYSGQLAGKWANDRRLTKDTILADINHGRDTGIYDDKVYEASIKQVSSLPDDPDALNEWSHQMHYKAQKTKDQWDAKNVDANTQAQIKAGMARDENGNLVKVAQMQQDQANKDREFNFDSQYKNQQLALDRQKASQGGIGGKLPESQQKQVIGAQNLHNAINEYTSQLKNWSNLDMASPDARAAMGTKYNNMMLQAKEAYNLGVLNGPDFEILQSVITDPRSLKGAITSNNALAGQATELDRMMGQLVGVSSHKVEQGEGMPGQSQQQPQGLDVQSILQQYPGATPEDVANFLKLQGGQ